VKNKLIWTAYSSEPRIEVIEKIKDIISTNDGYIMNFNMFSDLAITFSIEVPEDKITKLHNALKSVLKISDISSEDVFNNPKKEWLIFMNISFSKGTGELKIETPEVPG
jgi:hypothetical protein